jgi:prepilin-type N-terminal cleavage/methylation domain-containing protein
MRRTRFKAPRERSGFTLEVGQPFQADRAKGQAGKPDLRPGFTLIELLAVIAIIAILMALSAAAIYKVVGTQQKSNTQTLLDRINPRLKQQWEIVTTKARTEPIDASASAAITAMAGTDPNATQRARVIWIKARQKQAFPMTVAEAGGATTPPVPLPPLPAYKSYLNGVLAGGATIPATHESSVLLVMILERGASGGGLNAEELGGNFLQTLTLSNGQTVRYFGDSWGVPLVFNRSPWNVPERNPGGAAAGKNDPGDPEGLLNDPNWVTTSGATQFSSPTYFGYPVAAGTSFNLTPLLASAGPDKQFGTTDDMYPR